MKFLKDHNVSAPMFNIYEWGGYLMWDAWPLQKTFVDGRALNESVFQDYMKIAYNYRDAQPLLDKYGVQVLLLQGFEYWRGTVYMLSAALSDPNQTKWKLVYQDKTAMIFMRQPPPGVTAAQPRRGLHQSRGAVHGSPAARAGQAGLRARSGRSLPGCGNTRSRRHLARRLRSGPQRNLPCPLAPLIRKPLRRLPRRAAPAWLRPLLLALTAILFLTWFTGEVGDTDIWLHLMTGRHTLETRALTVPDPFCYTSNLSSTATPAKPRRATST